MAAARHTGLRSPSGFLCIGQAEGGCAAAAGFFAAYIGQPLGGEEASGIAFNNFEDRKWTGLIANFKRL